MVILTDRQSQIWQSLNSKQITDAQIDPFGFCNAKCWYCPVRYQKNPTHAAKHMPIELMDKILGNLVSERDRPDGIVSKDFRHFYTAHYNEILLYKHLEEMLQMARHYGLMTMILSNGVNLTDENIDILARYKDVLSGINLNIPAFEEGLWQDRSGVKHKSFSELKRNIEQTMKAFPEFTSNGAFSIGVNIPTQSSMEESGGWMQLGENAPKIDLGPNGESKQQVELARSLFPGLTIYPVESLIDRAAILARVGVIDNSKALKKFRGNTTKVVGCSNGQIGRAYGWLHTNALGEAFLCCNDYDFDYVFGSFVDSDLRTIWYSNQHADVIERAFDGICTSCASSVWA